MNLTDTTTAEATVFLSRLRESTSPLHLALESNTLLSSLTHPALSLYSYQAYLCIMSRVISYYENEIQGKAAILLEDWTAHHASLLIHEDRQVLEGLTGEKISVPEFKPAYGHLSDNAALGFTYVMEGSKLGGRVIFKQIKRHLGLDENRGAKYLADYGSETLVSWKKFLQSFSSRIVLNNGEEQAIQGANLAFLSIAEFIDANKDLYEF